ncbi:MAG: hypothetical protein DRI61_01345 [Chloroflexi bacterium]|nr:MAG: hypothetical protein DRI61_01345 [Chloroflexota bacterium]
MPKGYTQLVIYLKDEEEREKIKQFCEKAGIPVSVLVREFFRSLLRGQGNSIVINSGNKIEIGEINIDLKQNVAVQINNNIIAFINLKLQDLINQANAAIKSRSTLMYQNALVYIRDQLKNIINEIKTLSPRGH